MISANIACKNCYQDILREHIAYAESARGGL
jgi:hypothetical protein